MKFVCDQCNAQYMIADEKVGSKGVRVRCKKCSNVIHVQSEQDAQEEEKGDLASTAEWSQAADPAGEEKSVEGANALDLGLIAGGGGSHEGRDTTRCRDDIASSYGPHH